ncbi:MAG: hypothetical protein ABS46_12485 [Cytophagaceae bacterium SCN 52-12]|nr:MAG: hypothetical protein ABS46_12485 [Cytophagaceae bacterium SCN 52-12]
MKQSFSPTPFCFTWVLAVFLLSGQAEAQDTSLYQQKAYLAKNGTEIPYRILYPVGFDPSVKYPLVLFLHGAGERGNDNQAQLVHGSSLFLEKQAQFPAIVVFPQCPKDRYWSSVKIDRSQPKYKFDYNYKSTKETPELSAVMALLKDLRRKHKIDRNRIYIMGLSMGGMGTFEAITRHPRLFAAAVPVCAGGDPSLVRKFAKRMPLWVFHGAEDAVVHVDYSREMVKAIESAGGRVKYTEYPGVNHNSWDNAFAEPELFPWLFSQKKK